MRTKYHTGHRRLLYLTLSLLFGLCTMAAHAATIEVSVTPNPADNFGVVEVVLVVGNEAVSTANGLTVEMVVPANLGNFDEALVTGPFDPSNSCNGAGAITTCQPGELLVWNIGNLPAGQSRHMSFATTVGGSLVDNDTVTFPANLVQSAATIDSDTAILTVDTDPDLSFVLTQDQDPVAPSATVRYQITFGNIGGTNIDSTEIQLNLPTATAFVDATEGGVHNAGTVTWNLNTLAQDQLDRVEVWAVVSGSTPAGSLLVAEATIDGELSPTEDVSASAVSIAHVRAAPPLEMAVHLNPSPLSDNVATAVEILVSNSSNSTVTGATMQMRWPNVSPIAEGLITGPVDADASCGGLGAATTCSPRELLNWNLGALAPGDSVRATFTTSAPFPYPDGTLLEYTPRVTVANQYMEKTGLLGVKSPSLALSIEDDADPVAPGDTLTYVLRLGNRSGGNVDAAELTFELPEAVTFVSATHGGVHDDGVVFWDLGTAATDAAGRFEVVVDVDGGLADGALLVGNADLYGELTVTDSAVQVASVVTQVQSAVPLALAVKLVPNPQANSAATIVDITLANPGNSTVFGATMQMRWPIGASTLPEAAITGAVDADGSCGELGAPTTCSATELVNWNFGDLAPGQVVTTNFYLTLPFAAAVSSFIELSPIAQAGGRWVEETATIVVDQADLALSLDEDFDPVPAGGELTYTLRLGNVAATNVNSTSAVLVLPQDTTFVSATGGGVHNGGVVTWNLATLPQGRIEKFAVVADVAAGLADGALLVADARIEGDLNATDNALEEARTVTQVQASTPLRVAVEVSPNPVLPGDTAIVEVTVSNPGPSTVFGTEMEMRWPMAAGGLGEALVIGDLDADASCFALGAVTTCSPSERLAWNFGDLAPGQTVVTSVPTTPPFGTEIGESIEYSARVFAGSAVINDTGVLVAQADGLTLVIDEEKDPIKAGEQINYAVRFGNVSGSNVDQTALTFRLPEEVTFVDASGFWTENDGVVQWDLNTLPDGLLGGFTVAASVPPNLTDGTLLQASADITGQLSVTQRVAQEARVVTQVRANTPLSMAVAVNPNPRAGGDSSTMDIVVSNPGPSTVFGVTMDLRWPALASFFLEAFVSGDALDADASCDELGSVGTCSPTEVITWNFGNLAAGQTVTTSVPVNTPGLTPSGTFVTLSPRLYTGDAVIEATGFKTIHPQNLTLALEVVEFDEALTNGDVLGPDHVPVAPDDTVTYSMVYANPTQVNRGNVTLTFLLPEGTELVSASPGGTFTGRTVIWQLNSLAPHAIGQKKVKVHVDPNASNGTLLEASGLIFAGDGSSALAQQISFVNSDHPLDLTITALPTPALASETITIDIEVTNTSVSTIFGTIVRMRYPDIFANLIEANIPNVDAAASCFEAGSVGTCTEGEHIVWNIGPLAAGQTVNLSLSPTIGNLAAPGESVVIEAEATASGGLVARASYIGVVASQRTDSDGDGIGDLFDVCTNLANIGQRDHELDGLGDECDPDDDNDGVSDAVEIAFGLDPFDPSDAPGDPDQDGCTTAVELREGSDPFDADSDDDGIDDCTEIGNCTDPQSPDNADQCTSGVLKLIILQEANTGP